MRYKCRQTTDANLLQSWKVIESVATFTLDVSVFGPLWLSVRNEPFLDKFAREHRSRDSIEVKRLAHHS